MTARTVREEAVDLLLCVADVAGSSAPEREWPFSVASMGLSTTSRTWLLAEAAYGAVLLDTRQSDALEAAALLRDGWSPGDPVVRR